MPSNQSPPLFPSRGDCVASDTPSTVVWVRGEHDAATAETLSVTLAEAAALGDADVVVDLSGLTFMDASTIGTLVVARNRLRVLSRSLCVRDPSLQARRVLDLCEMEGLIDERAAPQPPTPIATMSSTATALGSWVEVPARAAGPGSTPLPVAHEAPSEEPVCVMARRSVEPARLIQHRRAPS